jgi:hypothetical protein
MNAAISWGNRIIPNTTATAAQSSASRSNQLPRAHCLARRRCQNPNPSNTTESPKSQGRKVVKKALAVPAPRAATNPAGRQQLIVARELSIAATETEAPVACFTADLLAELRSRLDEPFQPAEGKQISSQRRNGS